MSINSASSPSASVGVCVATSIPAPSEANEQLTQLTKGILKKQDRTPNGKVDKKVQFSKFNQKITFNIDSYTVINTSNMSSSHYVSPSELLLQLSELLSQALACASVLSLAGGLKQANLNKDLSHLSYKLAELLWLSCGMKYEQNDLTISIQTEAKNLQKTFLQLQIKKASDQFKEIDQMLHVFGNEIPSDLSADKTLYEACDCDVKFRWFLQNYLIRIQEQLKTTDLHLIYKSMSEHLSAILSWILDKPTNVNIQLRTSIQLCLLKGKKAELLRKELASKDYIAKMTEAYQKHAKIADCLSQTVKSDRLKVYEVGDPYENLLQLRRIRNQCEIAQLAGTYPLDVAIRIVEAREY